MDATTETGSTAGQEQHDGFPVSASSLLSERRLHTLKQGDMFGVFDQTGDVLWGPGIADGLYFHDTRYLSGLTTTLMGARPILLSATVRENNVMLSVDMTNTNVTQADGEKLDHDLLHVRRSRFLWNKTCYERLEVRNFDVVRREAVLELGFAADFADLFEARGSVRKRRGTLREPEIHADRVLLSYDGLDNRRRTTMLRFSPEPESLTASKASFRFSLAPGERILVHYEIECDPAPDQPHSPGREFLFAAVEARRALRLSSSRAAAIATSNEIFNEAIRRCVCDIYMLLTDKPTGPYPYAGVPWFSTAFGRDALITAMQTLWLDPAISRGVLNYLALHQADREDPVADAEPGKILHEVRHGEMAELGEVPFRHYYGSVDSTPLFVMLAGEYLERTGDVALMSRLWPNIERAIEWIDRYGDRDGDGFVEYGRRNSEGLINQGWKDSYDSVFHADGTLAEGPIALCEVQGYVYGARRAAALIGRRLGRTTYADRLDAQAESLKIAFNLKFWDDALGTYAMALDGHKKPCLVRSSNVGHLLLTDIALPERVPSVVRTLMDRSSFSGWGIRTIPQGEARYNPMAYHNGSVWPHDNALIGLGFARQGYLEEASRVFHGLFDAAFYTDLRRLPELFCGFGRNRAEGPVRYPVACSPQAWAAAALPALVQATLGLSFDPDTMTVHFRKPRLPPFLDSMTLYNLAVGGESVTVRLVRVDDEVAINVVERTALIRVQITS
ncbi:amylo-alpha-1,6-glucosidase [Ameyamaea chiangmaiensis NBRC 103196]|uniref:Amylo-alpha-1,6-glucosidase n=1 Tax=Ameyamaea chiangmaiensis TaxID=442969 RepID=A0A850PFR7_9PROT|nr:amylo-alpha-1,6-glucosidase [Ameyamaea chiangmaiensis]MBS4075002.1 amylo-alpha-1,6-glucosidase [Ameyamaea chiangmaiensis]NVN41290.1 amylo-alpha-1,6-glucosidase [Ameyamaea chiangmaiensis]GBQ65825.1 amylo-alpha-1,6-glucosidase [Ameyamaea chiangmaiensis NBRC 103196]